MISLVPVASVDPSGAGVVVPLFVIGLHPGRGKQRDKEPVKQKQNPQVIFCGVQIWPKVHGALTSGGTKWTLIPYCPPTVA